MSNAISRRGALVGVVASAFAPLAGKVRSALGGRESVNGGLPDTAPRVADGLDAHRPPAVDTCCYDERGRLLAVVAPAQTVETTYEYEG